LVSASSSASRGVGGGSIMTPLLITVFGVPAPIAGVKLLA
jgi:uncharacterized membrane protein YfcA